MVVQYILAIVIAICILILGAAWYNTSRAQLVIAEARAEAIVIQARADAQATVILAAVPLVAVSLGGVGVAALGLAALVLALKMAPMRRDLPPPQVVILGRGELWRSFPGPEKAVRVSLSAAPQREIPENLT